MGLPWSHFGCTWVQLGVTLGVIFMKIMKDNGRKVKNGPQKRHLDVEWHMQCISYRLVSDPNGSKSRIYAFSNEFEGSKVRRVSRRLAPTERAGPSERGRGRVNPPPRRLFWRFGKFGGLMVQGLYTPRGQRPRRTLSTLPVLRSNYAKDPGVLHIWLWSDADVR